MKSASSCHQHLQALSRRHEESLKSAQGASEQYQRECISAGLEGKDVYYELGCAMAKLPMALQVVLASLCQPAVKAAMDSYARVCLAHEGDQLSAIRELQSIQSADHLQQLPEIVHYLCGKDTHMHESGTEQPTGAPTSRYKMCDGEPARDDHAIAALSEADKEITSLVQSEGSPSAVATQVEWEIGVAASGVAAPIMLEQGHAIDIDSREDFTLELPQCEGHPAAHRLAFDPSFRSRIIADIYELHGYLSQMSKEQNYVPTFSGFLPSEIHSLSYDTVCASKLALDDAIDALQRPAIHVLMRASRSKEFADRWVKKMRIHLLRVR